MKPLKGRIVHGTRVLANVQNSTAKTLRIGFNLRMQGANGIPAPKVLLIEGDRGTADKIRAALAVPMTEIYEVLWARSLAAGILLTLKKNVCAVLVNLSLPDSKGIETFNTILAVSCGVPILIIGSDKQEELAEQAVLNGAHDYLPSEHLNKYSLPRALHYACRSHYEHSAGQDHIGNPLFMLDSIGDAVLCMNTAGGVTYLNPNAESMTGWKFHEAVGRPVTDIFQIVNGTTGRIAPNPMAIAIVQRRKVDLTPDCTLVRRDGVKTAIEDSAAPVYDSRGLIIGAIVTFHDVGKARAITLRMTRAAQRDPVTDLPNRTLLNDRIGQAISLAWRNKSLVAVLFLDLDGFKSVNDSLGHAVGDMLLQSVAARLSASVRRADTVSRQGGDEFVVLLTEIHSREDAAVSANKLLLALNAPNSVDDRSVSIHASIGISLYPDDGEDADTLIRNADIAMYRVKKEGCNEFQFFEKETTLDERFNSRSSSMSGG